MCTTLCHARAVGPSFCLIDVLYVLVRKHSVFKVSGDFSELDCSEGSEVNHYMLYVLYIT